VTTRSRNLIKALLAVALTLLFAAPCPTGAQAARLEAGPWPAVQDAAPDFTLDTVEGLPFTLLEAAAGRPIVLQFAGCT